MVESLPHVRRSSDSVALGKGLVEDDRDGREQIGKDALRGQTDGDAADAQACDEAGDVHAQIAQDHDQCDGEDDEGDEDVDQLHRVIQRLVRILARMAAALDEAGLAEYVRQTGSANGELFRHNVCVKILYQ